MRGFVALIGLFLVVIFVENISGELIHAESGGAVMFTASNSPGILVLCSVEHNGINYGLYPKLNLTGATFTGDSRYCSFFIRSINLDHAGEWKIHTVLEPEKCSNGFSISTPNRISSYTIRTIRVEQMNDKLLPTNLIHGEEGSYATVYFKDYFDNITKCYIIRDVYHDGIPYILSDNGNGTSAGLQLYKKCGVRIPITDEWRGEWKLVQESGKYKIRTGIITIVPHSKITSPEELHVTWRRRATNTKISLNQHFIYLYCELYGPDGQVITFTISKCELLLPEVSEKHAGVWKFHYFSIFRMNAVEQKIVVHVIDPQAIETTVTTTEDNMIHILCQTYVDEIQFCVFKTPNGTMINAIAGNGNEKYMYYGIGYQSISETDFAQCGITIIHPSNDDYGIWQCAAKDRNSNEIIRSSVSTAHLAKKLVDDPHGSINSV